MSAPRKIKFGGMRLLLPVVVLLWIGVFLFAAWPSYRDSRDNDVRVVSLTERIETLGGWSGGMMPFAERSDVWEQTLAERFDELFPRQRNLKELFYEIAAAADRSGVDPIRIRVVESHYHSNASVGQDPYDMGDDGMAMGTDMGDGGMDGMDIDALYAQLGLSPGDFPGSELEMHRLAIDSEASYENLTRFVASLDGLSRAVTVQEMTLRRGDEGVAALIELEYYVQAGN